MINLFSALKQLTSKAVLVLLLLCINAPAMALSDTLQTLSPNALTGLAIAALSLLVLLLIILIVFKVKITKGQKARLAAEAKSAETQALIDQSINGVIELDGAGTVVYANQTAAYYFEKK